MLVAYRSHPDETKAMRNAFNAYDVDHNGRVGRAEFQAVLKQQGYTDEEVRQRCVAKLGARRGAGVADEGERQHSACMHAAAWRRWQGERVAG